jgi:nitrate/nitrite-specific signal transduction histidine kinase
MLLLPPPPLVLMWVVCWAERTLARPWQRLLWRRKRVRNRWMKRRFMTLNWNSPQNELLYVFFFFFFYFFCDFY